MSKEYEKYLDYVGDDDIDGSILTEVNSLRYIHGKAYDILLNAFETQCSDLESFPYRSRESLSWKEDDSRLRTFIATFNALDRCVSDILSSEFEKVKADALREYTVIFDDDN